MLKKEGVYSNGVRGDYFVGSHISKILNSFWVDSWKNSSQLTSFCEIETSGYSSMFVFGNARINTINVFRRKQRNVNLKMILKK